jgi:hypothetical protein
LNPRNQSNTVPSETPSKTQATPILVKTGEKTVETTPVTHAKLSEQQLTIAQWLWRALGGFAYGWVWSSLVCLAWVAIPIESKGDMDLAKIPKKDALVMVVLSSGMFASVPASFLGALIGTLVGTPSRVPVLDSSAKGAAWSAALGLAAGPLVGWIIWSAEPKSPTWIWTGLGLSVPAGLVGGWLGGRVRSHAHK